MATPSELHPDLAELAFLLGDWSGTGEGVWPPGETFDYAEDVSFEYVGDPFLLYTERSWSLDDGSPIHFENGFLRPAGPGVVELVLAHPIGITEVAVGTVDDGVLELASTAVGAHADRQSRSPSSAAASRAEATSSRSSCRWRWRASSSGGTSARRSRAPEACALRC